MSNEITKLHLVYFSPSGSTEKIVRTVASGLDGLEVEMHDLLTPASRRKNYSFGPNDLVIMGCMTAGMIFGNSTELFDCLHADNTPFIGIISYGNGYYGIALTQMKELAENQGFKVAAMGAFIAQHTIDHKAGAGRPDEHDREIMREFGKKAYAKIVAGDYELHQQPKTNWSSSEAGNKVIAYRETHRDEPYSLPASYKSKAISDQCIKCYTCVRNCPADAINIETKTFDLEACIGCWGCINRCPKHAITSTSQEMADIMLTFGSAFANRLEPEIFL